MERYAIIPFNSRLMRQWTVKCRTGPKTEWYDFVISQCVGVVVARENGKNWRSNCETERLHSCVNRNKIDMQSFCYLVNSLLLRSRNWNKDETERWRSCANYKCEASHNISCTMKIRNKMTWKFSLQTNSCDAAFMGLSLLNNWMEFYFFSSGGPPYNWPYRIDSKARCFHLR